MLDLMKLLGSPEADRLISTIKRLRVLDDGQGLSISNIIDHLDRLERVSKKTGKSIKEVCNESMDLYESIL